MLKLAEHTEINQVSLTGVRALIILALLIESPKSFKEIHQSLIDYKLMQAGDSTDIIRIDINTLKNSGCEITRAGSKTNFKYTLLKHPFSMEFTKEEISVLKRAYNKIKSSSGIELMLKYDELFKKLAANVTDCAGKEVLYGISVLKNLNTGIIKELIEDCAAKRTLTLMYQNPSAKEASQKVVSAQKVALQNDSVYLYCFDFAKKESVTLNIKRILSIISRISDGRNIEIKTTNVKFFLKNSSLSDIDDDEVIVEELPDSKVIEGKYYNDFIAMQRILSFGADCTVLEPADFREKVIEKLKSMKGVYNG